MVGPYKIDDIMTENVVTIDTKESIKDALDAMEKKGVRKIVVTKNNKAKYILEDWTAWRLDKEKKIEDFEKELRPVEKVQSGTSIEDARKQLELEPAVIVTQEDRMIGIATATDLTKLTSKGRFWKIKA